jgi:hypothetical protein
VVAKGLLKTATKIDLSKFETVAVNAELPSVNLKSIFPSPKDCLIVFDDLERCSIPISDTLGYINSFVEHEKVKVIVIANEKDIENRGEYERYKTIKEKLIGKTLEIRPTESIVSRHFIGLLRDKRIKEFLGGEIEQIIDIHHRSESNNLRVLRQGIWDFERLATCFSDRHWTSLEAMRQVLRVILSLSFEIRLCRLSQQELPALSENIIVRSMRRRLRPRLSPRRRAKGREKFHSAKIQSNPLKRLDSDERIQGNPSFSNPQKRGLSRSNGQRPRKPKPTARSRARPMSPSSREADPRSPSPRARLRPRRPP